MKPDRMSAVRVDSPSSDALVAALGLFKSQIFQTLRPHGNTKWQLHVLCGAAIAWAWSVEPTLSGRYHAALATLGRWFPTSFAATTYQGFIKALAAWTPRMAPRVTRVLRNRMESLPGAWKIGRWNCFAIDGTKIELPWTAALEPAFGLPAARAKRLRHNHRTSANSLAHRDVRPQVFLTLLWHMASGLPWAWRSGPVGSSERDTLREMLGDLPPAALIFGDAGFNGFDLWWDVLASRRHFLFRVGQNVTLLKKLGYRVRTTDDAVYLWPANVQKRLYPPLALRLLKFRTAQAVVCLVTDLTCGQLSDGQAAELYKQRWGIEGFFRGFKQTFRRRKLLSAAPAQVRCELEWSLIGLWLICLAAAEELVRAGESPQRLSVAGVLRAVRLGCGRALTRLEWRTCLRRAVKDRYQRRSSKQSRHHQRRKRYEPCGVPEFRRATREERRKARIFERFVIAA